jgi:hypothetical protein
MTETSGSFTGRTRMLHTVSLADVPGHELQTVEVVGTHSSPDSIWNNARVNYWGVSDLVAGSGSQRGYYANEHPDGGLEYGAFEGKVTTDANGTRIEGTWRATNGTGIYAGMKADGTFTVRLTSPSEGECSWQGRYELATSAQAA